MKILYRYERQGLDQSYIDPGCKDVRGRFDLCADHLLGANKDLTFSDGFVLYEVLPQKRMMFSCLHSESGKPYVANLPYLYFGLRYFKSDNGNRFFKDGSYIYPGTFHSGLQLCFTLNPIQSFDDEVYKMPTDSYGYVCTDHRYDYSEYESLEELTETIIGLWYGYNHACYWGSWKAVEQVRSIDNYSPPKLKKFLVESKFRSEKTYKSVVLPDDAKIMR